MGQSGSIRVKDGVMDFGNWNAFANGRLPKLFVRVSHDMVGVMQQRLGQPNHGTAPAVGSNDRWLVQTGAGSYATAHQQIREHAVSLETAFALVIEKMAIAPATARINVVEINR